MSEYERLKQQKDQIVAHEKARIRREALEEAAKLVCRGCCEGAAFKEPPDDIFHVYGYGLCDARAIREKIPKQG